LRANAAIVEMPQRWASHRQRWRSLRVTISPCTRRSRPRPPPWDYGDCVVQVDLHDGRRHLSHPRGPRLPALEVYRLSPEEPPFSNVTYMGRM